MKYFDAVVVGAGLAGSTAARTLAEQGRKVLVVEKHRHIAGHCHDARNEAGITIHTYGPHISIPITRPCGILCIVLPNSAIFNIVCFLT